MTSLSATLVAAFLWAGWHGHLTPSICDVGTSDAPHDWAELRALVHARWSEDDCDGHATECRFTLWHAQGGSISIAVDRARVDFWIRACRRATDNETHYTYTSAGAFVGKSGPTP